MRRIVIAGGTGLVGSHLLPLFEPEDEIHVLARGEVVDPPTNVIMHKSDLSADLDVSRLPQQVDAAIVLSQSPDFREFPAKAVSIFDVNVRALLLLLDYARRAGASHFVSASSGGVYGAATADMTEDMLIPADAQSGYYISTKVMGEILAENYAAFMNMAVLRIFFAYGKGQKRSMLLPRLVDNVREGRPISLDGTDGLRINPVHAADAAEAVKAALNIKGFAKINVAGPEVLSLRDISELIGSMVDREPVFEVNGDKKAARLIGNTEHMTALLSTPTRRLSDHIGDIL